MGKKLVFSLLAFCILLMILETAARLAEFGLSRNATEKTTHPGWQTKFFESFLDWHESDPDFLWRFKTGLDNPLITTNSEHILGNEISSQKEPGVCRILLLGDSSPVGLGLKSRNQAFGEILQYLLDIEYCGNRKFELVNAAVSGYTSEQITRFLKQKGWSYRPDLILLYCGNNDASISGSCHDREILGHQKLKAVRKLLSGTALYRVMKNLLTTAFDFDADMESSLKARVTPEQYRENIDDIARQCRKHNCPIIILKSPTPLLWPAGLQFRAMEHMCDREGEFIFPEELRRLLGRHIKYCTSRESFERLYGIGDIFTINVYGAAYDDMIPSDSAVEFYRELVSQNPGDFIAANNLGVSYWENGEYREADKYLKQARELYVEQLSGIFDDVSTAAGSPFLFNIGINLISMSGNDPILPDSESNEYKYLDSARQADFFSLRIKQSYLQILDSIGRRDNVYLIDLPRLFAAHEVERLFIDHCHPTPEGHQLIASAIMECITDNAIIK